MDSTSKHFSFSSSWVSAVAEAIGARNGVRLKDCLTAAEEGHAVTIENDSSTTLNNVLNNLWDAITSATQDYRRRYPLPSSPKLSQTAITELVEKERASATETALRVAVTGALASYQRKHRKIIQIENQALNTDSLVNSEFAVTDDLCEDLEDSLERSVHNTLLKGLLFAFEAFKELHAMRREHYPPRIGHRTTGTIGWDTLVLLHFVHHIPQIARRASGVVVDNAMGQIVRNWRKLLVDLQNIDTAEAPEHSRRRGALALVNGLLTILFERHNTHQCAVLLNSVDHAEKTSELSKDPIKSILQPSQHMTSEVIMYYYYHGRMRIYERRFDEAYEDLKRAYTLLPPLGTGTEAQHRNKQRVRFFLAVSGTARGKQIPVEILNSDQLLPLLFSGLELAISRGDPVAFDNALERYGPTWSRRGVYLILQQSKFVCYAMLVTRVYEALSIIPVTDNTRITMHNLVAGYKFIVQEGKKLDIQERIEGNRKRSQASKALAKRAREQHDTPDKDNHEVEEMSEDRMMLWMSKLISRGYIRGYISYEHKTLVVARRIPFPFLTTQ